MIKKVPNSIRDPLEFIFGKIFSQNCTKIAKIAQKYFFLSFLRLTRNVIGNIIYKKYMVFTMMAKNLQKYPKSYAHSKQV